MKQQNEKKKDELDRLIDIDENQVDNLEKHYIRIINLCHELEDTETGQIYYKKLLSAFPSASKWNSFAVFLYNNGIKRNVMNYLKRGLSIEPLSIIFSNIIYYATKSGNFNPITNIKIDSLEYINKLKRLIGFAKACVEEGQIQAFEITDNITISEECPDYNNYFIVKKVFDFTKENPNRSCIRALLLSLCANIEEVKLQLRYKGTASIGHYTRVENLKDLVKIKKETRFRLSNVLYVNDPSEGIVFYELLKQINGNVDLIKLTTTDNRVMINSSNTFLCSFSENIDSLPMWVQYGNDGKGCCLIINRGFFDDDDEPLYDIQAAEIESGESTTKGNPKNRKKINMYCIKLSILVMRKYVVTKIN